MGEFPGGPVVRMLCFHYCEPGFNNSTWTPTRITLNPNLYRGLNPILHRCEKWSKFSEFSTLKDESLDVVSPGLGRGKWLSSHFRKIYSPMLSHEFILLWLLTTQFLLISKIYYPKMSSDISKRCPVDYEGPWHLVPFTVK